MHKCVKCSTTYELPPVEAGCTCGSKVFLYVRGEGKVHVQETEGSYEIDLPRLLGVTKNQEAPEETTHEIDLKRLLAEPLKEK